MRKSFEISDQDSDLLDKVTDDSRKSSEHANKMHSVRSFVRRQGRLTKSQRSALERHGPHYIVEPSTFNWAEGFASGAKRYVEIGFGMGESLCHLATGAPDALFVGMDIYEPGIGRLLGRLADEKIDNVRIMVADAAQVFTAHMQPSSLHGVYIYFPDPWPKKRHHKRRLIQPKFCSDVARSLCPGARLSLATDCEDYARHMLETLRATDGLRNIHADNDFLPRPVTRQMTKFERRGLALGHCVFDLVFERLADS